METVGCHTESPESCCCGTYPFASQRGVPGHLVVDSDLDAFSQYPSLDSIATPVYRLIADTRGAV